MDTDEMMQTKLISPEMESDPSSAEKIVAEDTLKEDAAAAPHPPKPLPCKLPMVLRALAMITMIPVFLGLYFRYIADRPLVGQQKYLISSEAITPSTLVLCAKKDIHPGDIITADHVSLEPLKQRPVRYPIRNTASFWGLESNAVVPAGTVIDARNLAERKYQYNRMGTFRFYVVATGDIRKGDSVTSVRYVPVRSDDDVPAEVLVADNFWGFKATRAITAGTVVKTTDVVKKSPEDDKAKP